MSSVTVSFTGTGLSNTLTVKAVGEVVTIALSNTYVATVRLERESGAPGSGSWLPVGLSYQYTSNPTNRPSYKTREANERLRFNCTAFTSGTVDITFADLDKLLEQWFDAVRTVAMSLTEAGLTVVGTLTQTGAAAFAAAVTMASTLVVTGAGTITGLFTSSGIVGSDASLGIDGQAAAQGGAVNISGGQSSTAGNSGGAVTTTGGPPGATGVGGTASIIGGIGGATSGKGGKARVTGGAGTNGDADGGDAIITPGAADGTGLNGLLINRPFDGAPPLTAIQAPSTGTTATSMTEAFLLGGIHVKTPVADQDFQVPNATEILAALGSGIAVGDSFDFTLINLAVTDKIITLTVDTGVTFVGPVTVDDAAPDVPSYGTWRFHCTDIATPTFIAYRIG